jgi:WD40 repeat protein
MKAGESLTGHHGPVSGVAALARHVVSSSRDMSSLVWDAHTLQIAQTHDEHETPISLCAASASSFASFSSDDRQLKLFKVTNRQNKQNKCIHCAFSSRLEKRKRRIPSRFLPRRLL